MQMASACVNNIPTTSGATYTSYEWLSSRVSLSRDYEEEEYKNDLESSKDAGDFEFRLGDNATMLPADELFSDGKLVPLQFSSAKSTPPPPPQEKSGLTISEDPYLFSPKAPRCSSRWRELLGFKKLNSQQPKITPSTILSTSASASSFSSSSKSIKLFLNRNSKTASSYSSSFDSSYLSLPLLKDSSSSYSSLEFESISISSSRPSLSSTSSCHDHDELPRASLDSFPEKPNTQHHHTSLSSGPRVRTRPRMGKEPATRGVSVDSPRMNPSGKVVFQSLERSSSSPSCFNGGPRHNNKHNNSKGVMERSYSANVHVRITPILNVPVCSLRGSSKSGVFGFANFFSSSSSQSQKKECNNNGK